MSGKFHYFSFGSNLCVDRIRINNKSAEFFCVGLLKGYKFAFQRHSNYWKGATANILRDSDESEVYGIIWLLDESDLENLDRQELNYERIEVNVQKVGTDEFYKCWTYTQIKCPEQEAPAKPSLKYKNIVVNGAKLNKFPDHYVRMIEEIEDNGEVNCGPDLC